MPAVKREGATLSSEPAAKKGTLEPAEDTTPSSDEESNGSDSEDDDSKPLAVFSRPSLAPIISTLAKPDFGNERHMWFQTTQVSHISTLFKCLSKFLSSSANVIFAPGGFRIISKNSKNTALVYLRITEQTLEEGLYDCTYNYRVSLPIDELASRIRMFRRSEVMSFTLRGNNPDTIRLDFSTGRRHTDIELVLRTTDDVHIDIPDQIYHTQVDLPAEEFREIINSVKSDPLITDVTFTKSARKFSITVATVNGKINTHFESDNTPDSVKFFSTTNGASATESIDEHGDGEFLRATFPIAEITAITDITRASKWVQINMPEKNGPPVLKMTYALAALGEISFFLSQKIDQDEEFSYK